GVVRSLMPVSMPSGIAHHRCGPEPLAAGTPLDHGATPLSRGREDSAVPGVALGDLRGRQSSYALKPIPVQKPSIITIRLPPARQTAHFAYFWAPSKRRSPATPAKQQSIQEP